MFAIAQINFKTGLKSIMSFKGADDDDDDDNLYAIAQIKYLVIPPVDVDIGRSL